MIRYLNFFIDYWSMSTGYMIYVLAANDENVPNIRDILAEYPYSIHDQHEVPTIDVVYSQVFQWFSLHVCYFVLLCF